MSQNGLASFDRTIQATNIWLDDVMVRLPTDDRQMAYRALRTVLQVLRDHLGVAEVASFAAQLPAMVRGVFYEGWQPAGKPLKDRRRASFLARVAEQFTNAFDPSPETICRAVFETLNNQISEGEIENVRQLLPHELRTLWPALEGAGI